MKILPVNSISNTYFKNSNVKSVKTTNPYTQDKKRNKLVPALAALACAGIALIYLNKKLTTAALEEPIYKILNGGRDIQAVEKYKQYIAQKKLNSLQNILVNCGIKINNPHVYEHIKNNQRKLMQMASTAV